MEEIKKTKTEKDICKYINEERKSKSSLGKSTTMEDWHKHFCKILEGRDKAIIAEQRNIGEDDEEELADEEIEQHIQILKKKKARGADGISGEALKYCKGNLGKQVLIETSSPSSSSEGVPRDWRKTIIVPIFKKDDVEDVRNYRGVSVKSTVCRISNWSLTNYVICGGRTQNVRFSG